MALSLFRNIKQANFVNCGLTLQYVRPIFSSAPSLRLKKTSRRRTSSDAKVEEIKPAEIPVGEAEYAEYSASYKCTEYYGHSDTSFYDIENDMLKDRLPQPDSTI